MSVVGGLPPKLMLRGLAVERTRDNPIRQLRPNTCAERIAVAPLDEGTMAQIVWFLGESQIQLSEAIPIGLRAAVAQHFYAHHAHECCTRACPQARAWMREFFGRDWASQTA